MEIAPETLDTLIPEDAESLIFLYNSPLANRERWVARVISEIRKVGAKPCHVTLWFVKGVSDKAVRRMMHKIQAGLKVETLPAGTRLYLDVNTDVSTALIQELIQRHQALQLARN